MPTEVVTSSPVVASMSSTHHTQYYTSEVLSQPHLNSTDCSPFGATRRDSGESQNSLRHGVVHHTTSQIHKSHGSTSSTSATGSTTSSPMTSSSLPEQPQNPDTPSTSPDTPSSTLSYPYNSPSEQSAVSEPKPAFRFAPSPTTIKRQKNPKNLALNTAGAPTARAVASAALPAQKPSEFKPRHALPPPPPSAFVVKADPPRRKSIALGLTLQTPSNSDTFGHAAQIPQIPPTPSLSRPKIIRQASTPSFSSNASDVFNQNNVPHRQFASTIRESPRENENYEPPESQEKKPDAYPDGPICIYEPHVDLYFEPTVEEAAKYDVVINVASEVRNPFLKQEKFKSKPANLRVLASLLPTKRVALKLKPVPADGFRKPESTEYIHVPWEHNSDLVHGTSTIPPLGDIIRIIDDRVSAGKRVLIHCQCGVSRSASLIVAYGIYKNPSMTVQEAYDMVKKRSSWIGPNMNLIMQLQDYRNSLIGSQTDRNGQKSKSRVLHGRLNSEDPNATNFSVPQTAPLPTGCPPRKRTPSPIQIDSSSTVSPGPSSAPSDFHWPTPKKVDPALEKPAVVPIYPESPLINPLGDVIVPDSSLGNFESIVPGGIPELVPTRTADIMEERSLASQPSANLVDQVRSEQFAMSPAIPIIDDPSFGITSPRESTFATSTPSAASFSLTPPRPSAPFPALAPLNPLEDEPSMGLFSPRSSDFPSNAMSLSQTPPSYPISSFRPLAPTSVPAKAPPRRLGFANHRSMFDLRSPRDNNSGFPLKGLGRLSPPMVGPLAPLGLDLSEELMSPRATEFTSNPFHDAFPRTFAERSKPVEPPLPVVVAPPDSKDASRRSTTSILPADPRSPAQKGSAPIVRNIMDVLESGFSS